MAALAGGRHEERGAVKQAEDIWREPKDSDEKAKLDALKRKYRDAVFMRYSSTAFFLGLTMLFIDYATSHVLKEGEISPFKTPAWVFLALGVVGLSIVKDELVDSFVIVLRNVSKGFNEDPLKWLDSITGAPNFLGPALGMMFAVMAGTFGIALNMIDRQLPSGESSCPKCNFGWAYSLFYVTAGISILIFLASYQGIRKFLS